MAALWLFSALANRIDWRESVGIEAALELAKPTLAVWAEWVQRAPHHPQAHLFLFPALPRGPWADQEEPSPRGPWADQE